METCSFTFPDDVAYKAVKAVYLGSFGAVCQAEHKLTNESFAVKAVFVPSTSQQPSNNNGEDAETANRPEELTKRLCREIRLLSIIKSPYIVELRNAFWYQQSTNGNLVDTYCLVMELEYKDLHTVLHEHDVAGMYNEPAPLPLEVVKHLAFQMFLGLNFLHNAKIIHRDIKPHSLLVDKTLKHLKITNFSLARASTLLHGSERSGSFRFSVHKHLKQASDLNMTLKLGPTEDVLNFTGPAPTSAMQVAAFGYRSPELILGLKYDTDTDMWSAGCTLAEMCSGEYLTPGENPMELMIMMMNLFGKPSESFISKVKPSEIQNLFQRWLYKGQSSWGFLVRISEAENGASIKAAHELISKLVRWEDRLTAKLAARHPFFGGVKAPYGEPKLTELPAAQELEARLKNLTTLEELRKQLMAEIKSIQAVKPKNNAAKPKLAVPSEPSATSPTTYGFCDKNWPLGSQTKPPSCGQQLKRSDVKRRSEAYTSLFSGRFNLSDLQPRDDSLAESSAK